MKTKSKRFLNLATLCLALLGTTLLMAHPVKAEVARQSVEQEVTQQRNRVTDTTGGTDGDESHKQWNRGYDKGYEEGLSGSDRIERDDIDVPEDIASQYRDDYKDGYEGGFEDGRRKAKPIETFLEEVWEFFASIFKGWFGSDDNSQ
ncbi:TPA: hypothetical protein ACKTEE_001625 [Streptococcus pyogenes]|uniref:hypothetical protein n=1 Tax=Streptococcus pyogenes TaxID=1314 RepID=UPI000DA36E66|nr:hypothetical protein [Streptococcus pyogenes]UEN86708.1 hypothetical protein H7792_06960 [Streptococcus pyogenes]WSE67807.1 hypothetical protein VKP53_07230 [Streptococcus pyogenes]WSE67810.1 hypothetical protein VKP53_07255 [Streptococcus pyogenes]SQF14810.1 hypothetical membrane associated protein [Streptococcus pyogenes]VGT41414.1 hypothetical membrane associated protein [Streptococcus pyogenes]